MPKRKLKSRKTTGVWLMKLKPVKRIKGSLAQSKLGILIDDSHPPIRKGEALFNHIPRFHRGKVFQIPCEGMYTVSEINKLVDSGHHKIVSPPKPKKQKKGKKS